MTSSVGVVFITYNSAAEIEAALDSLRLAGDGVDLRVVVVDNGSSDDTAERVERHPDVHLVRSTNVGYAGGINRGAELLTDCDSILVLNPDLRLRDGCVAALQRVLDEDERVGIVAPRVLTPEGRLQPGLRRTPTLLTASGLSFIGLPAFNEYVADPAEYLRPRDAEWAVGAALLVRRRCHDELGGWDESFFLYSEETDFCLRARDRGWRTRYEPSAVVEHVGGASGTSGATHAMQIVNRVRLYRRRHRAVASYAFWCLTILSELTWLARGERKCRTSLRALLVPSSRPPEIGASDRLVPR